MTPRRHFEINWPLEEKVLHSCASISNINFLNTSLNFDGTYQIIIVKRRNILDRLCLLTIWRLFKVEAVGRDLKKSLNWFADIDGREWWLFLIFIYQGISCKCTQFGYYCKTIIDDIIAALFLFARQCKSNKHFNGNLATFCFFSEIVY